MRLPPPPVLLMILVGIGILTGLLLNPPALTPWPLSLSGMVPLAGGIFLLKASFDLFRRTGTSPDPDSLPKVLITEGPYRWVRNPIYIGFGLIHLGVALLLGSVTILILLPIFFLFIHFVFVRREEWVLEDRFGEEYRAYRRAVPRWFPRRPGMQRTTESHLSWSIGPGSSKSIRRKQGSIGFLATYSRKRRLLRRCQQDHHRSRIA